MVVLEGDLAAVEAVGVGFDRHPEIAPDEVDLALADRDVDIGWGNPVPAAEGQEDLLELAAGLLASRLQAGGQASELRLSDCSPEFGG